MLDSWGFNIEPIVACFYNSLSVATPFVHKQAYVLDESSDQFQWTFRFARILELIEPITSLTGKYWYFTFILRLEIFSLDYSPLRQHSSSFDYLNHLNYFNNFNNPCCCNNSITYDNYQFLA